MGQRASDTRGITFEDVVVPAEVCYIKTKMMLDLNELKKMSKTLCSILKF